MISETRLRDVVVFSVDGQQYALPVTDVKEMSHLVEYLIVPGQPDSMLGIITYRGETVPLIYARSLFDVPLVNGGVDSPILITHRNGSTIALVVDAVEAVRTLGVETGRLCDYLPENSVFISSAINIGYDTILVVDLDRVQRRFLDVPQ